MSERLQNQTLMIDADDTLWENNHLFDRAIADFIAFLDHRAHSPKEIMAHLNRVEQQRVKVHGYGLKSFRKSLAVCYSDLKGIFPSAMELDEIDRFTALIADSEIELLADVADTLASLAQRHRLLLVTKGDDHEQRSKLRRSGLAKNFTEVEVLPEKHTAAYEILRQRHAAEAEDTWMIGNSPKSDINPALAAGLNAVHVPHSNTWVLEHEPLEQAQAGRTLLVVDGFANLLQQF